MEIWRETRKFDGNLEIWRKPGNLTETWKFDGKHEKPGNLTVNRETWKTWKFDGNPGNLTVNLMANLENLEIWRETWKFNGNLEIWRKPGNLTGNLEIWRETWKTWKFDGKPENLTETWKIWRKPGNLTGNLEIWRETWKFDGKPGNLTGNLEIWKGTWKFDGEPTNLTGVARNSSYADDSWLPPAFSVAHLAASSNCLLSLVLDLLVWFLTSNFGP